MAKEQRAKGKLKFVALDKGFGYLVSEELKQDVRFNRKSFDVSDVMWILEKNKEYEFTYVERQDPRSGDLKLEAKRVFVDKVDELLDGYYNKTVGYRFLNPYNFVTFLGEPDENKQPSPGRHQPPPHDRYVGITGKLTCTVKVETPLFISDSEEFSVGDNQHKTFSFFKLRGQHAIPASTLRGMVRSVFEAATNSCMEHFFDDMIDGVKYPLEYREGRLPKKMVPARVIRITKEGEAVLEVLDCSYMRFMPKDVERCLARDKRKGKAIIQLMPAASVLAYLSDTGKGVLLSDQTPFDPKKGKLSGLVSITAPGQVIRVEVLLQKTPTRKGWIYQHFEVEEIAVAGDNHQLTPSSGQIRRYGYLHCTGPNIERKHDERVFFHWLDDDPKPKTLECLTAKQLTRKVKKETVDEYNRRLQDYWERNKNTVKKLGDRPWPIDSKNLPHPSTFVSEHAHLKVGDLVYVIEHPKTKKDILRPVTIPRMPYKNVRRDLLPDYQKKNCSSINSGAQTFEQLRLCPACRTFGWVQKGPGASASKRTVAAYAGRVAFEHAKLEGEAKVIAAPICLAILGSPKPTTVHFYLEPKQGPVGPRWKDDNAKAGYDGNNLLRGRKFYRHHGVARMRATNENGKHEYEFAGEQAGEQNRTIVDAVDSGTTFEFDLHFNSLSPVELGALLWSLQLDDDMVHRLGYGKPLGFGSIKIRVKKAKVLDVQERLRKLTRDGFRVYKNSDIGGWITAYEDKFKSAMQEAYGNVPFDNLPNIQDLEKLLSENESDLPIHYPRSTSTPLPKGQNFEWFMGNKRSKQYVLPSAREDDKGLPLITKSGEFSRP